MSALRSLPRILLGLSALLPLRVAFAADQSDSGPIRVGIVVDVTHRGRHLAPPSPEQPVFYLPVFIGYKELGGVLTDWQHNPPPMAAVQHAFIHALAQQGYRIATPQSPPTIVIAVRWGEIAPELLPRARSARMLNEPQRFNSPAMDRVPRTVIANRNELMTYIVGERWHSPEFYPIIDPNAQELVANLHDLNGGGRYFLLISALDYQAENQGRDVLLWRAHVSTQYWGHYLDQVLGTLIETSAPLLGRETVRPQIITAPAESVGPVPPGAILVTYGPGPAPRQSDGM